MKVSDIIANKNRTLSFEVFPPKTTDKFDSVRAATEKIAQFNPDFMSVTYGAGGSGSRFTLPIAANIEKKYSVPVIHHLTCVGSKKSEISGIIREMKDNGIENILALRGDIPEGADPAEWDFLHASELAGFIHTEGDFCVGGACYPEGHPESPSIDSDLKFLAEKVRSGCEFLTTQLFLDNDLFYSFLEKLPAYDINVPVVAGIMPITRATQFARIGVLAGSCVPEKLIQIGEKYVADPVSMFSAGIEFAVGQINDLLDKGVKNVHIYTMNNPDIACEIIEAVGGRFAE